MLAWSVRAVGMQVVELTGVEGTKLVVAPMRAGPIDFRAAASSSQGLDDTLACYSVERWVSAA